MSYRKKQMEVSHLRRALSELIPFTVIKREPFDAWIQNGNKITLPYSWAEKSLAVFECNFRLDRPLADSELYLNAWFGGETLIKIDQKPYGQINQFHKEIDLLPFCDGKSHHIEAVTVPRGLFGTREEAVFRHCYIVTYNKTMRKMISYTQNVISVIEETDNESLANYLIDVANDFLQSVDFPRDIETYKKGLFDNPTAKEVGTTWTPVEIVPGQGLFDQDFFALFTEKFTQFKEKVKKAPFPKYGTVYVTGHSHIDYAWLWPVEETKRKIVRTFANAVSLARKYDYFIYSQSSAQMYRDLKETEPKLFEEVKSLVKEGRWEVAGGMWVESDCRTVSVESLIRQFYYGQKFFENEFGRRCDFCWLPDVFGFSWVLPQILLKSGIKYFVTTKLTWNESNEFPYDICLWQGIDGSKVLYYSFKSVDGYNGNIDARSLISCWRNFRQKELTDKVLISVGYGDGGGGPTEEMCENYVHLNEIPGVSNVRFSTISDFLKSLKLDQSNLPVWNDELYLELHRGTLTSQSRVKRLHKQAEDFLRKVEIINALTDSVFQERIDELWKTVLRNEFHDILPGSSIREVNETAEKELEKVIHECVKIIENCVQRSEGKLTVFNPSSYEQKIIFTIDENLDIEGFTKVRTYDGKYLYYSDKIIEPLQVVLLTTKTAKSEKTAKDSRWNSSFNFESENFKFTVHEDGTFNLYDKRINRWIFRESGGNKLVVARDVPYYWDNWDIDVNHERYFFKLTPQSIKLVEQNELRVVLEVLFKYDKSSIVQNYIFWLKEEFIEVKTKAYWNEKRVLLKALFETDIKSRYAKFDLDCGYIERPTSRNTTFEQARFEVLAHRWVDLSQYDYGVSIINDGKYGHSVKHGTIAISLIKSGVYPDFYADIGTHEFSYVVYPHLKLDLVDVVKFAERYNKSVEVFNGVLNQIYKLHISKRAAKILSVRKLGNSYYLRFAETVGSHEKMKVVFEGEIKRAYSTNLLDDVIDQIKVEQENSIFIELNPFEIKTIRMDI